MRRTEGQQTQTVSQEIIDGQKDVNGADQKNNPEEDVRGDIRGQIMRPDGSRSRPEERNQCPGIWACDNSYMRNRWQSANAPEQEMLVDKVGNHNDLGGPEVVSSPEEDPRNNEEVVQDEVRR
jgi:hypothetical protein